MSGSNSYFGNLMSGYDPTGDMMHALPARPTPFPALSRLPFQSETDFFRVNPHVGGMAAEDNRIVMNPFAPLSPDGRQAVQDNESLRIAMRTGAAPRPSFDLTPFQQNTLGGYSPNAQDRRETVAARLMTGDPSGGIPSAPQREYLNILASVLRGGDR